MYAKIGFFLLLAGFACSHAQRQSVEYGSPQGYDLNAPEVFELPRALREVSGIAFRKGNPDTVFAQQDEDGILFYFALGDREPKQLTFGKSGDYEDIAVLDDDVVILRSDGTLYRFALNERQQVQQVDRWNKPFRKGEYESLAVRPDEGMLYALCKEPWSGADKEFTVGYRFRLGEGGKLVDQEEFVVSRSQIERYAPLGKKTFRPSAMTWNAATREWFILSSINKLLVVTDEEWHVKDAFHLDPKRYVQPEGIAFDRDRNLYISNEAGSGEKGTIFKFTYR